MRHRGLGVRFVAGIAVACLVGSGTTSRAQEPLKEVRTLTIAEPAKVVFGRSKGDVAGSIRDAAAAVSATEDSDAKAAAEKKLADALDKVFEDDLKRREGELVKIEERLKKLRALVALRREKKQEIIDLQRNVVLHEAEGLGFYDQPAASGPKIRFDRMFLDSTGEFDAGAPATSSVPAVTYGGITSSTEPAE
jgi:hypothetical protein